MKLVNNAFWAYSNANIKLFLIICLFFFSCADKQVKKNNLENDFTKSLQQLSKNPSNTKLKARLEKVLPAFFAEEKKRIAQLEQSKDMQKWEEIATKYEKMNQIFYEAAEFDTNLVEKLSDFKEELIFAKTEATRNRIREAERNFADTSRQSAIIALQHYKKAGELNVIAADTLKQKLMLAYERALICMFFEFESKNKTALKATESLKLQLNDLFKSYNKEPFTKILADNSICKPKFNIKLREENYEFFKDLNKTEIINLVDSVLISDKEDTKKVFQFYHAEVSKFSNTLQLKWQLQMQIFDVKGKLVFQKKIIANKKYTAFWARFRGDKRALTDEVNENCEKPAGVVPSENAIIDEVSAEVFLIFKEHLRVFLKGI